MDERGRVNGGLVTLTFRVRQRPQPALGFPGNTMALDGEEQERETVDKTYSMGESCASRIDDRGRKSDQLRIMDFRWIPLSGVTWF